jgi:hypothetical protein
MGRKSGRKERLTVILIAALLRSAHWLLFLVSPSSRIHYWPVLGAQRFETSALEMLQGIQQAGPLVYASPVYRYLVLPFYLPGLGRTPLLVAQSILGILTALVIYEICRELRMRPWLAVAVPVAWTLYAPVLFFELTVLPISWAALTLCTGTLLLLKWEGRVTWTGCFVLGILAGLAAGVRPPLGVLAVPAAFAAVRAVSKEKWSGRERAVRAFGRLAILGIGVALPLLPVALYQSEHGAGFYPFPRATGLTLILGHNDDATGFGPPAPSVGLVENDREDLRAVSLRVAAENGAAGAIEADRYWSRLALQWIGGNPGRELELLLKKAGGFFGHRPFDVYYDIARIRRFNSLFRVVRLPRIVVTGLFCAGLVPFLLWAGLRGVRRWALLAPVLAAVLTSLVFVHSERFFLPVVPQMLVIAGLGLRQAFMSQSRPRAAGAVAAGLLLLVPAVLRPVPAIPEGLYLRSLAARAYNMTDYELALTLYERSALLSPEGSINYVQAHQAAARVARAMGLEETADAHEELAGAGREGAE